MNIRSCLKDMVPYTPGKYVPGAIKLASNENPLGVSPKARDTLTQMAGTVSLYPDGACVNLKAALAARYSLSPDNFIVGNGSDEVLVFIAGAYLESGDNAITSTTTFSEYAFATRLFGGEIRFAPMKDGRIQLDTIASMVDISTKIIFLCNPNNPTGTYFTNDELGAFIKKIPENILIVIDEAYREYATASDLPDTIKLLKQRGNMIILRTFSKIYGLAGLRVGYGISDSSIVNDLNKTREPFNVNLLAQAAAKTALDDKDFVAQSIKVNEEGKIFLYKAFDRLGLKYYPTQANFIFVYLDQDGTAAFEKLMTLGVTVRPTRSFGIPDAIRVTIGTQEQNTFFIDCLEKVLSESRQGVKTSEPCTSATR